MKAHRLFHFAEDSDTSGFFPALAKYHDRAKYRMRFGTLKPMAPWLEQFMRGAGVETFSCRATSRLQYPLALARLARFLKASGDDIFHAHLFDPAVVGLTAARLAGTRARILTRHYSNYHTRIDRPIHVKLDQWCTTLAHQVIAVSRETATHLVQAEGAPPAKVTAIHNGIDFDRVKPTCPEARERLRAELGPGNAFLFLVAARLHPEKGYETLFKAARFVKNHATRPFQILVAGRGPSLEGYREICRSLDIASHVRFLGFRQDLPDLMVASDLFVLPSVAEAFGLVLAEALFLGLPVLSTWVGGIPEIVDDGVDGRLVPPGNPDALATAMLSFLDGGIQLPGMGGSAVRKVRERFDFERMVRAYEGVYERALNA